MGARILIVDDEPNTIVTLRRALELAGHSVRAASTIATAREELQAERPDLCLLDVRLPDGDGIDLLEGLRASGVAPAAVMMSGHASIDDAVRALRLGALDFLEKPIGHDRLLVTVTNALAFQRLSLENERLREEARDGDEMLGESSVMAALKGQIQQVAPSEGRVLISGENGTGKELIARAIHSASARVDEPFISINCAAVPNDLIESELFGHEKGAFTGAVDRQIGKFERAHGGTLFLDEVGDMPAAMQAKLLRVLQSGELERVGGRRTIKVDVRIVAATNKDLEQEIAAGRFREDLFYRLNVVPLVVPPLRKRKEDLPILVERFLKDAAERNHREVPELTSSALAALAEHDYPGNVRELKNLVERIVILAPRDIEQIDRDVIADLVPSGRASTATVYRAGANLQDMLRDAERMILAEAIEANGGAMASAARALGLSRSYFYRRLKKVGLRDS